MVNFSRFRIVMHLISNHCLNNAVEIVVVVGKVPPLFCSLKKLSYNYKVLAQAKTFLKKTQDRSYAAAEQNLS
jgi:hypothetical protein